jgi:predicted metal-dependent hydrolase
MTEIEVIRSRRKTLSLEVLDDGRVRVRAPLRSSQTEIRRLVEKHSAWIGRKLQEAQRRKTELEKVVPLEEEELRALQKRGKKLFAERAAFFAPAVGVRYGRITVRRQRSKWGSCSAAGNLNFNCLLLLAPPEVLDYVVVHELCHRLEMNHSPRFWAEVRRVCPEYERCRRYLREYGSALMARLPEKDE